MVFICINELGNASVLFLFDIKKKEPFGGGEPRQDREQDKRRQFYVTRIDFKQFNYPSV